MTTTNTPPPAVHIVIKQLRESAGLTQAELARRLGVPQPQVARWESGRRHAKIDSLQRIADALGLNLQVIFSAGVPTKNPERD